MKREDQGLFIPTAQAAILSNMSSSGIRYRVHHGYLTGRKQKNRIVVSLADILTRYIQETLTYYEAKSENKEVSRAEANRYYCRSCVTLNNRKHYFIGKGQRYTDGLPEEHHAYWLECLNLDNPIVEVVPGSSTA